MNQSDETPLGYEPELRRVPPPPGRMPKLEREHVELYQRLGVDLPDEVKPAGPSRRILFWRAVATLGLPLLAAVLILISGLSGKIGIPINSLLLKIIALVVVIVGIIFTTILKRNNK